MCFFFFDFQRKRFWFSRVFMQSFNIFTCRLYSSEVKFVAVGIHTPKDENNFSTMHQYRSYFMQIFRPFLNQFFHTSWQYNITLSLYTHLEQTRRLPGIDGARASNEVCRTKLGTQTEVSVSNLERSEFIDSPNFPTKGNEFLHE